MQTLLKRRVVVLGGYGEFSRRVATDIAALPAAECILGLPPDAHATAFASRIGVPFMVLDPNEPATLNRLLDGTFAVVNVHGPFATRAHLLVAERCAALGVHYVDPAESREYIAEFARLAREAREHDALLVTGAGATPAVTSALAGLLAAEFDRVGEIHVFITPGTGDERDLATTRAVLEQAPSRGKGNGRAAKWSQTLRFPAPVGRRHGFLCDAPDLDLFTKQFGARTITARAGLAPGLLSGLLRVLALMRRRGWIEQLSPFTAGVVRLAAYITSADADSAAIRVAMRGTRAGVEQEHLACLIGRGSAGPAIAAAPIVTLVRRWLERGAHDTGAMSCTGLLSLDDLKPELARHDIVLVRE